MPASLRAKFLEGVEESTGDADGWQESMEMRPSRLGLGADPKKGKKVNATNTERRVANLARDNQESDEELESRAKLGSK